MTITLKDGRRYDGILSTGWWDEAECPEDAKGEQAGLVMKVVRQVVGPDELTVKAEERRVFQRTEFVSLAAKDADLYNDERTVVARSIGDGVLADTEIEVAGRGAGEDRELVRATTWLGEDTALDADLSSGKGGSTRGWDQFAVNERLGARSNYSDDLYTTKLTMDKYTPEQLARAQALAAEIEKKGSTNKHVLEERGLKELDDNDDEDEEAKYSMVMTTDGSDPSRAAAAASAAAVPGAATAMAAAAVAAAPAVASVAPSTDAAAAAPSSAATEGGEEPKPKMPVAMRSKLNASAKAFVPGRMYTSAAPSTPGASGADAGLSPPVPPQPQMGAYGASPPQMMGGMAPGMAMYSPGGMAASGMGQMQMGMSPPGGFISMAPGGMMSPKQSPQMQMAAAQQQVTARQTRMAVGRLALALPDCPHSRQLRRSC